MSGVYIPGIEIPTEKPIAILLCTDRSVGLYDVVARQLWHIRECEPAIPVPDHGRLIEEDAAYDKIAEEAGEEAGNYVDMDVVGRGLENTPTIIPADEEEEA